MSDLQVLRGMKDLLPQDYLVHKFIIDNAYDLAKIYGFKPISTPILESANVFDRSLGQTSEVLTKEIYSFKDRKERIIALRPEFTASIMRSVLSNNLYNNLPIKLFSHGPLFRYDRPQEGRQRQFHQLNFESIGSKGALSDAEIISLATKILDKFGILSEVTLELNSLGCNESRKNYQAALITYFNKYKDDLSQDSKNRLQVNPLRILDSKDEADKKIAFDAPLIKDFYSNEAKQYFDELLKYLEIMNIEYKINYRIARGLDYYCHTCFEFTTTKLGAQSTILAGGRYDSLSKLMGHKNNIESVGFAAGIERIALMKKFPIKQDRPIYLLPISKDEELYALKILEELRGNNIISIINTEGKLQKRLQSALADNAGFVIFIGANEAEKEICKIKNLDLSTEAEIKLGELVSYIQKNSS